MTKRSCFVILAVIVALVCGAAGLRYVNDLLIHRNDGPRHTYPLPGDAELTDEQAVAIAKQTLQLDGHFSEAMESGPHPLHVANRGSDDRNVSVTCWDPNTGHRWYVQLRRTSGSVDAVCKPGK